VLWRRFISHSFRTATSEGGHLYSSGEVTKKAMNTPDDEMRPEYDLRGGVRGKYYERYQQGTNVVLLDPDIADVFKDSSAVNTALRQFLQEHGEPPSR
jgi:hypothetical protein